MAEAVTEQIGTASIEQDITEDERARERKMLRNLARRLREFSCLSENNHPFHEEEKDLLSGIAKLLGLFIERERADEKFRHQQQALRASENGLRKFLRKTLSDREEEKKNLSINLHDELGSMVVSLGSTLSIVEEEIRENNPQAALDSIRQAQSDLKDAIGNMKQIAKDLRPQNLEIIGLPDTLRDYLANVANRTDIKTDLRVDVEDEKLLNGKASIVLYRVFQEALNNILRHAEATSIKAKLHLHGDKAKLEILDNGIGFDTAIMDEATFSGMGVRGMEERVKSFGGAFKIRSAPENGTRINVTVPIG